MSLRKSFVASIGLLVMLAGCGGGGSGSDSGPQPPPGPDTTPNAFAFTSQSDVALSTPITSNEVTISGITANASVAISGGEYSIDSGAFASGAGSIANAQRIRVRQTSAGQFSTATNATLTIGGVSSTFTVTTLAMDATPDAFAFPEQTNVERSVAVESAPATITGINTAVEVSINGGEYSIDGGAYTAAPGTVGVNQQIRVRVNSAGQFSAATSAVLTVGEVSATFTAITHAIDVTPDAFAFARRLDVTRDTLVESEAITVTGMNAAADVSIAGGEYSIDGGAFTSAAGTIASGQTLVVRTRSSATWSKVTRANVTVGTISREFEVTSEVPAFIPDNVAWDGTDVIFLQSNAHRLVFRWSVSASRYLDAYAMGLGALNPTRLAYSSAHRRLYFGYSSGAIQYIGVDAASQAEAPFATLPMSVNGLVGVGNYLLAQDESGAWETHYIINSAGVTTHQLEWNHYSREYAWDPVTSRVYFFRDGTSPNDLHYEVIDQATGQITGSGETPYHGAYSIVPPIRVSANGQHVLLGSGDLYAQGNLNWAGSLGSQPADARWFANGSLVVLTTSANQTALHRLDGTNLAVLEQLNYTGQALRVLGTDSKMAVLVVDGTTVRIHDYVPNDDSDGDGVANTADAFPLDRAASVDTDRDGYPDEWNAGLGHADSSTGLVLDAFPQDAACWLASHGSGGSCNYAATLPDYTPDQVVEHDGIIYLLSSANRRVYRWSISEGRYLNPYVVGISQGFTTLAPTKMALSPAHRRLYLGYTSGGIRYIDITAESSAETQFGNAAMGVSGLASVGNYVLAQDASGAWATHYIFNAAGTVLDQRDWNYYSREYAWDPNQSRVYFFRDDSSPNDLHYEVIDQATGLITSAGESPYHGSYSIQTPIRVSANGEYIVLGSGDLYNQNGLTWAGSLGNQIVDGRWFANGSLVTLTTGSNQTVLRRHGATNLAILEQQNFAGQALRVVGSDMAMVVLVIDNGTVRFHPYAPSDDSDGDGVSNTQDAFPLDVAASVDTDRDGYPDAWNPGRSEADSTTGLVLDEFPLDSACWLPAHGSGGLCDYGATIPNYIPDQVESNGDVVYLLSSANRRVYRWSISESRYLNPYVVGIDQGFSTIAPTEMAFSSAHGRLYLGYATGAIRYVDAGSGQPTEVAFSNTAMAVGGLASVGNYVLAQDGSGAWGTHYIFNAAGAVTHQLDWNYYSREYAWDPNTSRVYFFRDSQSPNDLHYEVIDQVTGQITAEGETPYHGDYAIAPPLRVSQDGQLVLLGSGDLYGQNGLNWSGSLGGPVTDARWFANGSLAALTTASNQTTLRRLGASNGTVLEQRSFTGQALRVVGSDTAMVVLVIDGGTVRFHDYVPNDDSDGDGVANTADAFPLDVAASVDTDLDGYPDAWNPGRSQADSTTGLTLDSYPNDSACWLPGHGDGVNCDYGATIPDYIPDQVAEHDGVIYLLSSANRRVYRRSIATGQYLNPYVVGINQGFSTVPPNRMIHSSAQDRLYLGYGTGAIRYIDTNAGTGIEVPFVNLAAAVGGIGEAGNHIYAKDASGSWGTNYVIDSAGVITDQAGWNYGSPDYAWDATTSRVYFLTSGWMLTYEVVDQVSGQVTSTGQAPYHGTTSISSPIRVSSNGQYVLVGSGDLYNQSGLTWAGSLGGQISDGRWFADGSLAVLTTNGNQTILRHRHATNLQTLEQRTFTGQALRLVGSDTAMVVLVNDGGNVEFHDYIPSNDTDGDGVANASDAFPLDVAASVDTDEDGYPDAWNPGRSQADSTTGLSLDSYPTDDACWLPAHGDGVTCDYGATLPNYIPDQVAVDGDVVYLLSSTNQRVYRWSMATGQYLNPYVVGIDLGYTTISPTTMVFSGSHDRLYLGYESGAVRYIDTTLGAGPETDFVNLVGPVGGLGDVGDYILVEDGSGTWANHYVIDVAGIITAQRDWNYYSREFAWDPTSSRVYFFRDGQSPNDLHYQVIDQVTGLIGTAGESPYHGTYNIMPPIRVSPDGGQILLGSGDFYAGSGLTHSGSLGKQIADAQWIDNLLVDVDTTDRVEIRRADTRAVLTYYQYTGQPLRVLFGTSEAYLLHVLNGTTTFLRLPFFDQDGDTLPRWWEQLHGLSDSNAGDAAGDLDSDGVDNAAEYQGNSNPTLADTDGDGLDDFQELVTHATNPASADSDGEGLDDYAEVITHGTDPWDTDSDNDGYTDLDEVLYGGDPNDPSGLPQPLTNYSQGFESEPLSAAWTTPVSSTAPWSRDTTVPIEGGYALRAGAVGESQSSTIRFRGYFAAGTLRFWARVDAQDCCDRLIVRVDGVTRLSIGSGAWDDYETSLTLGVHEIEWRYEKDSYYSQGADTAWIDNLSFVSP